LLLLSDTKFEEQLFQYLRQIAEHIEAVIFAEQIDPRDEDIGDFVVGGLEFGFDGCNELGGIEQLDIFF
jgi:hypothetical protein